MAKVSSGPSELKQILSGSYLSYLTGFYIFAFFLELSDRWPDLQKIRFHFLFGAILGCLCLYKFIRSKKVIIPGVSRLLRITYSLIFLFAVFTVFSFDRSYSTTIFSDRVLKFALLSFFIYMSTDSVADLKVIVIWTLAAWMKMASEGFLGWVTGSLVWENQGIPRLHGTSSMTGHPNSFSGFAVGCLPFCIFLFNATKLKLGKLFLSVLFVFAIIIVIYTGSRTGYVAVILGSIFFVFKYAKYRFLIFLLLPFISLIVFDALPVSYQERIISIYTLEEAEGASSSKRLEIIKDALAVSAKYPLGVGVSAFPAVRSNLFGRYQDTHNLYLEVLTNIGVLGFLVFIAFIAAIYKTLIELQTKIGELLRKIPRGVNEFDLRFLDALTKAVTLYLVLRLFLGMFGMDMYEIYWWLILGITLSLLKLLDSTNRSLD